MSAFKDVVIPFVMVGNRQCLTMHQLQVEPGLAEFVERFRNCFEYDVNQNVYFFYPKGKGND